jgi:hypothetical protein
VQVKIAHLQDCATFSQSTVCVQTSTTLASSRGDGLWSGGACQLSKLFISSPSIYIFEGNSNSAFFEPSDSEFEAPCQGNAVGAFFCSSVAQITMEMTP